MSTDLVALPVIPGALGPAMATDALYTQKTLFAHAITGTITFEGSSDGDIWCPLRTFPAGPKRDAEVNIEAAFMRIDARRGSAESAQVVAETGVTCSAAVPPPAPNGPGGVLDISNLGPMTTVYVEGIKTNLGQAVSIEVSPDGVHWALDYKTFTADGCFSSGMAARFIRATGRNGVVARVGISAQQFAPPPSSLDLVSLLKDGSILQLATYDDGSQTLLFQILEELKMILTTLECE